MLGRRVLAATRNRCYGNHFRVCRWMSSLEKLPIGLETASAGLKLFNEGWKMWSLGKDHKEIPTLYIYIKSPRVGKKQVPKGRSPIHYLRQLPELHGHNIDEAKVSHFCQKSQCDITISSPDDWKAFFELVATGNAPELVVECPWSLKAAAGRVVTNVAQLEQKHREMLKNLFASKDDKEKEIEDCLAKLKVANFSEFDNNGFVQEELGYSVEDWNDVVDCLVLAGLPPDFGHALKLAAKAKRGSNKALRCMKIANGVRSMLYMKFQVTRNAAGEVDALIAIYKIDAVDPKEGETNIEFEQTFKRFVELDAERTWRSEVKQFLEPSSPEE